MQSTLFVGRRFQLRSVPVTSATALLRGQIPFVASSVQARGLAVLHSANTVGDALDKAATAKPLKDALKFYETATGNTLVWAYRDLKKYTDAFANGLLELGYKKGDKLALWLPPGSPENLISLLSCSRIGVIAILIAPPANKLNVTSNEIAQVSSTIKQASAKGLIFWHEYTTDPKASSPLAGASQSTVMDALFPEPTKEIGGMSAFVKNTGKSFKSASFPSLEHVVSTGSQQYRGVLNYKSVLVYNPSPSPLTAVKVATADPVVMIGHKAWSNKDIMAEASTLGQALKLSPNPDETTGRLVISTTPSETLKAMAAAVIHETLLVSPAMVPTKEVVDIVAKNENAVVLA